MSFQSLVFGVHRSGAPALEPAVPEAPASTVTAGGRSLRAVCSEAGASEQVATLSFESANFDNALHRDRRYESARRLSQTVRWLDLLRCNQRFENH